MRFISCEKQFLYLNTDADAVNAKIYKWPTRTVTQLFFQHDSKLNKTMKPVTPMISTNIFFSKDGDQSTQYSESTNLMS